MTMQKKFEERFEQLAKTHKLQAVFNHSYSNTGKVYFQPPKNFTNKAILSFSFQQGYASFGINVVDGLQNAVYQGEQKNSYHVEYDKHEQVAAFFQALTKALR